MITAAVLTPIRNLVCRIPMKPDNPTTSERALWPPRIVIGNARDLVVFSLGKEA